VINILELVQLFAVHPQVSAFCDLLNQKKIENIFVPGLKGSSASVVLAALNQKRAGHYICVLNDHEEAGYFYNDLMQLVADKESVQFFPSAYRRNIKYGHIDSANEILRTETITRLQDQSTPFIVVTYPDALAEKVIARKTLNENTLELRTKEKIDSLFVSDMLDEYGFEQVEYVYEPGQYAIRGSILDVFSFSHELPYRVDFFGSEIETIRTFDIETQLSQEKLEVIFLIPKMTAGNLSTVCLFEGLPPDTSLLFMDFTWCKERISAIYAEEPMTGDVDSFDNAEKMRSKLIPGEEFVRHTLRYKRIHMGAHAVGTVDAAIDFTCTPQPLFHKNFDMVSDSLTRFLLQGYTLYILSDTKKQTDRIASIFKDRDEPIPFTAVDHTLHSGFYNEQMKVCCFTDHQIFDRFHKYNLRSDKARSGKMSLTLKELNQFKPGDFIVHIDHGVGQFGGLVRTEVNGKIQEAIRLIYKNNDTLFVSIHSLHKLSKYKGKESGEAPSLNKLGTGAWEKMKNRTKKKVKDIARDLILLYSKRRDLKGFAFSADTYMQQELEASFIYEDTPDQFKATESVKRDMERARPMDRLVCGDVGFGKTEVAIRSAFKAVTDGKQVAVLVPTTVLAFQHYQSFKERLSDFPCTIEYISRARTNQQVREILKRLMTGEIDILIGTHRLVSKDVKFKDLGLLVVDEEQKFGVSVKEKLRKLKVNVDTLTLTATPIPRTLQFSLMGARDLSSITTPPPNRYPIQTEVDNFDPAIIREAINFELSRNGQVFFINNRVQNIDEMAALVKREVPDARVCIGHGQMPPEKLEKVIMDFVSYEYDVLVATSIVENGIDVSNANTIIINNAHHFGLSDLHQLRGRVGRSNRKAFCYLLSPPLTSLSQESRRRLQAIESFSELGSGIHIAMQDLDIRGAGNMLGAEQSGFIADLGYETYQKILEEAVKELKKDEFADLYHEEPRTIEDASDFISETQIESDLEMMFPPTYVPHDSERVTLYRELSKLSNEAEINAFSDRLRDRFGPIPKEGLELIAVARLRRIGKALGFERLTLKRGRLFITLIDEEDSLYFQSKAFGRLLHYIQEDPRRCELRSQKDKRSVVIRKVPSVAEGCSVLLAIQQTSC